MAGVRAVLFDLDGVLVDTTALHAAAYEQVFAREGASFDADRYAGQWSGLPRDQVLQAVLGPLPPGTLRRLMDDKEARIRALVAERGLAPMPGAVEALRALRDRGTPVAVGTMSRTPELFLRAAGLRRLVDYVADRSMVTHPKPHPAIWHMAARLSGAPAEACLVVEDSPLGVEAARRAGARVVAVATTRPGTELAAADAVIDDLAGLLDWL